MALTDENGNGMVMPVAPMYGGGQGGFGSGWGSDGWWIILLFILLGNNGWGGGFGGGMFGGDGIYPWMNQSNQINNGFRDQMINDNVTSIRDGVFGLSNQLCNCCGDIQMSLANGFAGVEQGANARQIANMQTAFAGQTAMAQGFNQLGSQFADCCCENRLATERLNYTIATENCADRYEAAQNTRDILENCNRNNQAILDKLCQLELDAKNDKINDLERQLTMANLAASQIAQTAEIQRGQVGEVDALYQRLRDCPVPTQPVYGSQPIFTCPQNQYNNGCGCGCGNNF